MPEELLPCPNVCCQSEPTMRMKRGKVSLFVVICVNCGWSAPEAKPTREEAAVSWNTRPPSELERLAREVAKQYRLDSVSEMTPELSDPIDELAIYFERLAEPSQKGTKQK